MQELLLFSGLGFVFRFLPVFMILYLVTPAKHRSLVMVCGSLLYYAALEPHFVCVLMAAVIVNALLAQPGSKSRALLGIVCNVALLAGAKYLAFRTGDEGSFHLPVGLSFYLFKMISFQADLYQGRIRQKPGFLQTAEYFVMFPQLLQGPISRYEDLYGEGRAITVEKAEDGLMLFMSGFILKVLLADSLAGIFAQISRIGYESISTPLAWIGAYDYSMQLYYDFWGYSLMAAGLLMMMGFPFVRNFDHPYAAGSITEFYRRWHITLGHFFRDYVYIPLGGSRNGLAGTVLSLFVVWMLTGLWHGQGIGYLIWAALLLCLILWEKFVVTALFGRGAWICRLHVWLLIPVTWIVFAMEKPSMIITYMARLFPFFGPGINVYEGDWQKVFPEGGFVLAAGLLLLIPQVSGFFTKHRKNVLVKILLLCIFWAAVCKSANSSLNPFLYLQF
ncbi:MAG: MBOAT family protein [Lachnospiraceae bacterium]|nr:MBOAT family protein [Lachnospiraceae bacterium]